VLGKCNYDPSLLDVDIRSVQGILLCNQPPSFVFQEASLGSPISFDDQMALLRPQLEGILLCESVMWRYRSLIDGAQGPEDWVSIIKLAAHDGIRFETKSYGLVDQPAEIYA
jgi:hypothetical protein